jgi:hypothetical protein
VHEAASPRSGQVQWNVPTWKIHGAGETAGAALASAGVVYRILNRPAVANSEAWPTGTPYTGGLSSRSS